MTTRDPRHRRRRYDGAVGWQILVAWIIRASRLLAVPTVFLSLLLAVDALVPGPVEEGIAYRRAPDSAWLGAGGYTVTVGWPEREDCLERRADGRRLLYTTRPDCSGEVTVGAALGRGLTGSDTLLIARTPIFGQVRAVRHPATAERDEWHPLLTIGFYVAVGLVPLVSFGSGFAVHAGRSPLGASRRRLAYVLPVLIAEAVYVALVVQALLG